MRLASQNQTIHGVRLDLACENLSSPLAQKDPGGLNIYPFLTSVVLYIKASVYLQKNLIFHFDILKKVDLYLLLFMSLHVR